MSDSLPKLLMTNKRAMKALDEHIAATYGAAGDHPACPDDVDDDFRLAWIKAIANGRVEALTLFDETIVVNADQADTIAGLLNIACRAIEDKTEELKTGITPAVVVIEHYGNRVTACQTFSKFEILKIAAHVTERAKKFKCPERIGAAQIDALISAGPNADSNMIMIGQAGWFLTVALGDQT